MTDSYDYITVMEGPGLSGLRKYWFGYYEEPIECLSASEETHIAEPVGHYELPHPMTRPEIEEWALTHLKVDTAAIEEAQATNQAAQARNDAPTIP